MGVSGLSPPPTPPIPSPPPTSLPLSPPISSRFINPLFTDNSNLGGEYFYDSEAISVQDDVISPIYMRTDQIGSVGVSPLYCSLPSQTSRSFTNEDL